MTATDVFFEDLGRRCQENPELFERILQFNMEHLSLEQKRILVSMFEDMEKKRDAERTISTIDRFEKVSFGMQELVERFEKVISHVERVAPLVIEAARSHAQSIRTCTVSIDLFGRADQGEMLMDYRGESRLLFPGEMDSVEISPDFIVSNMNLRIDGPGTIEDVKAGQSSLLYGSRKSCSFNDLKNIRPGTRILVGIKGT